MCLCLHVRHDIFLYCRPSFKEQFFPRKTARARAAKPLSPGRPSNTKNRSSMTCAQVSLAWCTRVRLGSWTFVFACVVNANTGVYLPDFRAWDWRSERRGGLPPSECHNMRILRGVMMWHSLTPRQISVPPIRLECDKLRCSNVTRNREREEKGRATFAQRQRTTTTTTTTTQRYRPKQAKIEGKRNTEG